MHVIIVGAGQVGSSIAESLSDSHDVIVIDIDPERGEELTYSTDVLAIEGDGASLDTLREADVEDADMVIASTDDDETNIVTCGTAKTVCEAFTIARVKNTKFLDTWHHAEGALGVDFMVGTNLLTAQTISRVIGLPAAQDVDTFGGGQVQMAEFRIPEGSPVDGQTVQEADRFESLTFTAVLKGEEVVIPGGETLIEAGDDVVVIGSQASVRAFAGEVAPHANNVREVLIVGGSDIGELTASLLEEQGLHPKLVERDPERARELAEKLPGTTVFESDGTDIEFLEREHVEEVDVVVAALDSDEKNLLATLLAKRLGAERGVAVVDDGDYVRLFEAVGVDVGVNPREATAEEITRFTRGLRAENVAIIETDLAEVIEIEIDDESVIADRPIEQSINDLPDGVVVGALIRDGQSVIPRGDTVVEAGDTAVLFVDAAALEEATTLL
ncbi:MAG: Trk system potassium transporter TrkA [Haloarculaceae archaeon]